MRLLVHLTPAGGVVEVQLGVVDASVLQETPGQSERGGVLPADRWTTWSEQLKVCVLTCGCRDVVALLCVCNVSKCCCGFLLCCCFVFIGTEDKHPIPTVRVLTDRLTKPVVSGFSGCCCCRTQSGSSQVL